MSKDGMQIKSGSSIGSQSINQTSENDETKSNEYCETIQMKSQKPVDHIDLRNKPELLEQRRTVLSDLTDLESQNCNDNEIRQDRKCFRSSLIDDINLLDISKETTLVTLPDDERGCSTSASDSDNETEEEISTGKINKRKLDERKFDSSSDDYSGSTTSDSDSDDETEEEISTEKRNKRKLDEIINEFFETISNVNKAIDNISKYEKELMMTFQNNREVSRRFLIFFREIKPLEMLYGLISEKIDVIKSHNIDPFPMPDIFLDVAIRSTLNIYKQFLMQYANSGKWIGELCKTNNLFQAACSRAKAKYDIPENITLDGALYTVYYSLFSYEMLLNRYTSCYDENDKQYTDGESARKTIRNLLSNLKLEGDLATYMTTQKELSFLYGRQKSSMITTRFIAKINVSKMSRRDNKALDRQLVLFSDCLCVTTLPSSITGTCSVRCELSLDEMVLSEINNKETTIQKLKFGLSISAVEAQQDFFFAEKNQRHHWIDEISKAIEECRKIKRQCNKRKNVDEDNPRDWIGHISPKWQKDENATYCNGLRCCVRFTFRIRRHHCRADGLLYCDTCSNYKIHLSFERTPESRVCELCYLFLNSTSSDQMKAESITALKLIFQRKQRTGNKIGWLRIKSFLNNECMQEVDRFCQLHLNEPFMSIYERPEDKREESNIILLGMNISSDSETQFILKHNDTNNKYIFKTKTAEEKVEWMDIIQNSIRQNE